MGQKQEINEEDDIDIKKLYKYFKKHEFTKSNPIMYQMTSWLLDQIKENEISQYLTYD